jgi:uncharacterized RDD family membrane protein YckC
MENPSDINPYQSPMSTAAPPARSDEKSMGRLADRSARVLAWVADGLLVFAVVVLAFSPIRSANIFYSVEQTWLDELATALLWISAHYFIHGYWLATRGQTIGKMLMGIRIEDRQTGNLVPIWRLVLLRDLPIMLPAYLLSISSNHDPVDEGLSILIYVVDFIFIFTASRRCFHDRIANTKVVRTWS